MKKFSFFIICVICLHQSLASQGISFVSNKPWKDILALAKKTNKPIFLDAYATWCGPCKYLQQNVFTDNKVGTQYNKSFINVKMDMEKGEGETLAKSFNVHAYPTLLFLNSKGQVVHKYVGAMEVAQFISLGSDAVSPDKQFYTLSAKAKQGKLSPKLFGEWVVKAEEMQEDGIDEVISLYLQNSSNPLLNKDILTTLLVHASLLKEKELNNLKGNKSKIAEMMGMTNEEFDEVLLSKVINLAKSKSGKGSDINYDTFRSTIAKYFPNEAEGQTKKVRTIDQLQEGGVAFSDLILMDDEEVLKSAVNYYYQNGSDKKDQLNKAKQLSYRLVQVGKQDRSNDYRNYVVQINKAIVKLEPTNYFGRVEILKEDISLKETMLQTSTTDMSDLKISISTDYGSLAWYQLFIKDFESAIKSGEKGIGLFPKNDWIYTNIALGNLLAGKFDKAEEIYLQYKDKMYADQSKSFREAFLADLTDMENEGIITASQPDIYKKVNDIKTILKK